MISFAPGCISPRSFTAAGLVTPSQAGALSRWRFAKEYSDGSVFSKKAEGIPVTPSFCGVDFTPLGGSRAFPSRRRAVGEFGGIAWAALDSSEPRATMAVPLQYHLLITADSSPQSVASRANGAVHFFARVT